jgi:hypothetical protein
LFTKVNSRYLTESANADLADWEAKESKLMSLNKQICSKLHRVVIIKKKTTENQNCTGKIFIQQELKTKQLPCCINIVQVVS